MISLKLLGTFSQFAQLHHVFVWMATLTFPRHINAYEAQNLGTKLSLHSHKYII